ncbi:MAG: AraC family transcriptional regulator [Megasphaera sp.]|nr:AraC family transcriptional regulator [Megasphaera sp.]MCH4187881.1 AraC family transcriptional regulator [Megasphaera sp.]
MFQYTFSELTNSIFKINTAPRLFTMRHYEKQDKPVFRSLHTHEDMAVFFFVLTGSCIAAIDNTKYTLIEGDIALINSGVLHNLEKSDDCEAVQLGIKNLYLKDLERNHLIKASLSPVVKSGSHCDLVRAYIAALLTLAPKGKSERISHSATHITQGLLYVLEDLILSHATEQQGQDYNLGLQIKEYIDEHYLENLKLPDIAAALHVNTYYLSHVFKKMLGYSPIQYITHRRIGEAQNLLLSTNHTITEIAMRCGYNNSNYFQVVFNNIVGMPPGKYRKAWKSK